MSADNNTVPGLWRSDDELVPLALPNAALGRSANGDRDRGLARAERPNAGEFTAERMLRPKTNAPTRGWRRSLYVLTGGLVTVGPSRAELRQRELVAAVKTPITGCRKIAFISRKGGVGKTTTCLLAGHTFALYRGDRIIAVDGNPDAGTLGHRVRRETTANLTSLLADAERIERYADIRGYTSQAPTRLEVVASDDDPRITQAIGALAKIATVIPSPGASAAHARLVRSVTKA
jgi:putative peptide zinc metalloprotease protein